MKYIFAITLMIFCAAAGASAQRTEPAEKEKGHPDLVFAEKEYDFGAIPEKGKKVSYDFVFQNEGDRPLVITRVTASCRCITTSFNKKPIPPGGQGMITVSYDPKKQHGVFYKAIQVHSNAPEGLHIVVVKGEVKP